MTPFKSGRVPPSALGIRNVCLTLRLAGSWSNSAIVEDLTMLLPNLTFHSRITTHFANEIILQDLHRLNEKPVMSSVCIYSMSLFAR